MSAFGSGYSNGQFWYGRSTGFPGFLYKKNVGVGGRRSTKMNPGGGITCNSATYLYNKYKPGTGGVGASSIANRRAKNRLATVCTEQKCFPCYTTLGQYSNYTHNPNGFVPCPYYPSKCPEKIMPGGTFTTNAQLEEYRGVTTITGDLIIRNFIGQPDFSVFDCLTTIGGLLNIRNNSSLTIVYGFNALTSVSYGIPFVIYTLGFLIQFNPVLNSIQGFNSLTQINGLFAIYENIALINVINFDNLQTVMDYVNIQFNTNLTNTPKFNALTKIGTFLTISNNSLLTNVSGFLALTPATGIGSNVIIDNNSLVPLLNVCLDTYTAIDSAKGINSFTNLTSFTTNSCPP